MKDVTIYTDGACSHNPGPGGYGAILQYQSKEKEISGFKKQTTNNEMELMAAIKALEALKEPCRVKLYSDSAYLINAFTLNWIDQWEKQGWRKKKDELKNQSLWKKLRKLSQKHEITWIKVKGHSDNEYNNRADYLATSEIKKHIDNQQ